MGEKKIDEMKIHYVWDNWKIDYRLNLRKELKDLNEKNKIEMAKHLALEYPFLLKRQVNKGFRNLVYYKIV